MVEKPSLDAAPSNLALTGRYILPPEIFDLIDEAGLNQGEIQLTDAINALCKKEQVLACANTGVRYDIGNKISYIQALLDFSLARDDMKNDVLVMLEKNIKESKSL